MSFTRRKIFYWIQSFCSKLRFDTCDIYSIASLYILNPIKLFHIKILPLPLTKQQCTHTKSTISHHIPQLYVEFYLYVSYNTIIFQIQGYIRYIFESNWVPKTDILYLTWKHTRKQVFFYWLRWREYSLNNKWLKEIAVAFFFCYC